MFINNVEITKQDLEEFLETYDLQETFKDWINNLKEDKKPKLVDVA